MLSWNYIDFIKSLSTQTLSMVQMCIINKKKILWSVSDAFILLAFNTPGSWVFAAHPTSLLPAQGRKFRSDCYHSSYMLLAGTTALLNVEVPTVPIKIKKLFMRSDSQLDSRNWICFNWVLQPRLTSLFSCFFQDPELHLFAQAAGSPMLESIYLLLPVCNLKFSYFRILQRIFWAYSPSPKDLSVLFLTEKTLPWVCFQSRFQEWGYMKPPPASLSPVDVLCSITFALFMFWLREQQWWEGPAWLCNILCMQSKVTEPEGA